MSSRSALTSHYAAPQKERATAPAAGVQSTVQVAPAANDDARESRLSFRTDPLFGMAISSVILFAVLAALMALG
jgi:hypothetical protein